MKNLVAVGTVAFDDIETPFGRAENVIGGACTYIALAASQFIQPVRIVSVIGDDFPAETLDELRQRGVDLEGVQVKPGEKSFFWAGRYHKDMNGRDTLDTQLNVLATFDPVLPPSYRNADYLMLGNLPKAEERLAAGDDAEFMRAKIATARVYADHILSRAPGLRDSIVEGAEGITTMALESF